MVNWDPIDKTVLADEQVDENGNAWRSGAKVEKKYLKQWFIRTTKFAKELYDGLDDPLLEDWRDIVKLQKHWIGECNGVRFDFKINNISDSTEFISAWTDKPEYLHEVKFILLNRDNELTKGYEIVDGDVKRLDFTAENPVTCENVPIFVTNENLPDELDHYLGIPGLNDKDEEFARNYGVNFKKIEDERSSVTEMKRIENCKKAAELNRGGYFVSSKLKDWLISRQRYWGTPIPIVYCESCGTQPVSDLPVLLPAVDSVSNSKNSSPEYLKWVNTKCPRCDGPGRRETDTLDTFFDSSWYYLRYLDCRNDKKMFDESKIEKLLPVDLYIGGKEHATLHLYYARFVSYFLHSIGLVPTKEPFKRLLVQGMVMGRSFRSKTNGKYIPPQEVEIIDSKRNKAIHKTTKTPVVMSWEKMSKSKHNGVDPNDMFIEYGVDTTRLLIMADVAPTSHRNWNSNTFPGILNWQRRLWMTIQDFIRHRKDQPPLHAKFKAEDDYMFDSRNYYIKGATFNYCQSQQMSVAVSKMQGLTNSLRKVSPGTVAKSQQYERALAAQIILLAPMAPRFASELWSGFLSAENRLSDSSEIKWNQSVMGQNWPEVDMNYELDLICQINGHENAAVKFPRKDIELLKKEEALRIALDQEKVQQVLRTRTILDVKYNVYSGYENVLNIVTTQPPAKNQENK